MKRHYGDLGMLTEARTPGHASGTVSQRGNPLYGNEMTKVPNLLVTMNY